MDPRRVAAWGAAAILGAFPTAARPGHVVELGQYRYDPAHRRPELRIEGGVDEWRFEVAGHPGDPAPGEEVALRARVRDRHGAPPARIAWTIHRVSLLGARERVVDGREGGAGDARIAVALPSDAEYEVTVAIAGGAAGLSTVSFPLVVGRPGSPWAILGAFGGGLGLFLAGVVAAGRVRERRRA